MLTSTEYSVLAPAIAELQRAKRGERADITDRVARTLGCSPATAYRKLKEAGLDTNRKQRSDARESRMTDADLSLVAGVLRASLNNKGQRMPVGTALNMLSASGALSTQVHESTVSRQLYARRMHPEQMALPTPSLQLRSLHPNHVWQVDSTTGAYYYLPGGRLRWMPEDEFYKNKVQNLVKASSDLLTRYAATDHTSHAFRVRYYLGGESAENLLDFITWAMVKDTVSPMHGVPLILMLDPGAANKGQLLRNFANRTGIKLIHHAPGAARVTGSVEKSHDLVRMHFETRFRFIDPREVSLDNLNTQIDSWAASYCTTAVHTRHARSRFAAWMEICRFPGALRVAASLEALREAAVREPESRRVSNSKTIPFGKHTYDLTRVPGVVAGLKVQVVSNPFRAPAIDVLFVDQDTGEETWHIVDPMQVDEWGFRDGAPTIGEEFRTAKHSEIDATRADLTREAYRTGDGLPTQEQAAKARKAHAQAYAGIVDPMADVKATQVPAYLPRRGTPLALPERRVEARRISVVEACKAIKARIGEAYQPQTFTDLSIAWPEGVPEDQIDRICTGLAQPIEDTHTTGLRLIGGGAA